MGNAWDSIISESEREAVKRSFGSGLIGFGKKTALLVIDMSYGFVDSKYPHGCSETGWPCVANIKSLLDIARKKQMPVIYTTSSWHNNRIERGLWKTTPEIEKRQSEPEYFQIVAELAPLPSEPVIIKPAPSGFFASNMVNLLTQQSVDTVIVTGMVTSGCVYATAVDAFSYGYRVIVPEECVADRSPTGHAAALFGIHMKYGDVMKVDDVKKAMLDFS